MADARHLGVRDERRSSSSLPIAPVPWTLTLVRQGAFYGAPRPSWPPALGRSGFLPGGVKYIDPQNSRRGPSSKYALATGGRRPLFALPNTSRFTRVRVLIRLCTGRYVRCRGAIVAAGTRRHITDRRLGKNGISISIIGISNSRRQVERSA